MNEISLKEFFVLPKNSYELIDIRDQGLILYGSIPGAFHISLEELEDGNCGKIKDIPKEKKLIFYCQIGRRSKELGSLACLAGKECFSLEGGYVGYVMSSMRSSFEQEKRKQKAEESIRNRFHEKLFSPFAKACKTYQLISEGDHIGVCISGGKDSMLMAKLFQEIHRHRKVRFDLTFLVMDPGYNQENRALIEGNARVLGIPVTIFESRIFDSFLEEY